MRGRVTRDWLGFGEADSSDRALNHCIQSHHTHTHVTKVKRRESRQSTLFLSFYCTNVEPTTYDSSLYCRLYVYRVRPYVPTPVRASGPASGPSTSSASRSGRSRVSRKGQGEGQGTLTHDTAWTMVDESGSTDPVKRVTKCNLVSCIDRCVGWGRARRGMMRES